MHVTYQKASMNIPDNFKTLLSFSLALLSSRPSHTALRPAVQPPARSRHGTPARGLDRSMVCPLALPPHQHPRVPISSASVFQSLQAHETATGPATWQDMQLHPRSQVVRSQKPLLGAQSAPPARVAMARQGPRAPGTVLLPPCAPGRGEPSAGPYLVISTTSSCSAGRKRFISPALQLSMGCL